MGDELSRLASYEAECHRKDGVIAALRDEIADLKGAIQTNGGFRYSSTKHMVYFYFHFCFQRSLFSHFPKAILFLCFGPGHWNPESFYREKKCLNGSPNEVDIRP